MDWKNITYVSLDINGTGPNHFEKEGIIEIGAVKIKDGEVSSEKFFKRLNPKIEIPQFISIVHNLYNKDLENKPHFSEVQEKFFEFISGSTLICHNAATEKRLLSKVSPNNDALFFIDTINITRSLFNNMQSYSLQSIIKYFNLKVPSKSKNNEEFKSAIYEAEATALLFKHLISTMPSDKQNLEYIKRIGYVDNIKRSKVLPLVKFGNTEEEE